MDWNKETVIIYASNDGMRAIWRIPVFLLENNRQIPHMDIYVLSVNMCQMYQDRLRQMRDFGRGFEPELGI